MAHVSLNFEDDVTGEVAFRAVFTNGQDTRSGAHKLAVQVIKWLEEHAETRRDVEVEEAPAPSLLVKP